MHRLSSESRHVGVMSPTHYHSFKRDGEMAEEGSVCGTDRIHVALEPKTQKEAKIKAVRRKERSGLREKEKRTETRVIL